MAMSRSFGSTSLTIRPPISMVPWLARSRPAMMFSSVDLPQPDGPTSTVNSPSFASMSMPFSTSTGPKRLCRDFTLSVAIAALSISASCRAGRGDRSFYRARGQATDEIAAAEQIDQQRRQRCNDHRRALDTVLRNVGDRRGQRDQRCRYRLLLAGGESHAIEELVPDVGELPDHGDDQDRR